MAGRFLPPDPSKGDESTIGGYMAVHARPAAFQGSDGLSYSVAIETDRTDEVARPFGAYFLFVRWRRVGTQGVEGHLETPFLGYGATGREAGTALGAMPLAEVKAILDDLIRARAPEPPRKWWDVMRDEDEYRSK
jgi:FAD/FMN-containing dehydrogenase